MKYINKYIGFAGLISIILIYPLIGATVSMVNILLLVVLLRVSYFVGRSLSQPLGLTSGFMPVSSDLVFVYVGLTLLTPILFLQRLLPIETIRMILIIVLLGWEIVDFYRNRNNNQSQYTLKALYPLVLCALYIVVNVTNEYYLKATTIYPQYNTAPFVVDFEFFISLVSGFRDGNMISVYEQGTVPLYQYLSVIPASWISAFTGTSSQVALYGLYSELNMVVMAVFLIEIARSLLPEEKHLIGGLLALLGIMFLLPIHIGKVVKLDFGNFVFGGIGYVTQAMNVGYILAMPLFLIMLYLCVNYSGLKKVSAYFPVIAIINASLIGIKIPFFVMSTMFLGMWAIVLWWTEKDRRMFYWMVASVGMTGLLYITMYSQPTYASVAVKFKFMPEYLASYFNLPGKPVILLILVFALFCIYLLGIRGVVFLKTFNSDNKQWEIVKYLGLVTFILLFILTFFYNNEIIGSDGKILKDGSYDALQFIRCGFWLLTIISSVSIACYIVQAPASLYKKVFLSMIIGWGIIVAVFYGYRACVLPVQIDRNNPANAWLNSVREEMKDLNANNIAINASPYYDVIATASDLGNFWVSFGWEGYNFVKKSHESRREVMNDFLSGDPVKQNNAYRIIKQNHVDYFISQPEDTAKYNQLVRLNKVSRISKKGYIYKLL